MIMEKNINDYWKSEWVLLCIEYDKLKRENRCLKTQLTNSRKSYCDLKLKYETLLFKEDLQNKRKNVIISFEK